jgi:putative transposase
VAYIEGMRYADGGGVNAKQRAVREAVRLQAAEMFAERLDTGEIARRLRVSRKSVVVWRRAWLDGGVDALASKGAGGAVSRLSDDQVKRLEVELDRGPAAHGWADDQRWTLARVSDLIAGLFHVRYTLRGTSYLLHRAGWSPQVPARRAVERDDQAVTTWVKETWEQGKASPR